MTSISSTPSGLGDYTVLILDTVTTGLKSDGGEIIEIAAALYSVQCGCIISQVSTLLPLSRASNVGVKVNQIPVGAALSVKEHHCEATIRMILSWAEEAKYCVAHNAEHDRKWMTDHWLLAPLCQRVWLCSCYDFTWPRQERPGMHVVHLALAHGIAVTCANRALSSCQLIASLMTVSGEALQEMIERAARSRCKVLVKGNQITKEKALSSGFKWNATTHSWMRWMAIEELSSLSTKHAVIEVDARGNAAVIWARLWQMYISHRNIDVDCGIPIESLGNRIWREVRDNAPLWGAIEHLWTESSNGSIEPKGLIETFGAMEVWYWTGSHIRLFSKKAPYVMPCAEDLPDGLGSESGDATSQSDDAGDRVSVESVVEKVAESCLEPEDRQGSFSPFLGNSIATNSSD